MKRKHESEFTFKKIQFKSLEKVKLFAKLLGEMECEVGIRSCKITIGDPFICPDIDLDQLNDSPEETWVGDILKQVRGEI